MEPSEEILLNSLSNCGVTIPAGVSSVQELTPTTLFAICSHALRLIDNPHHSSSFIASFPEDSMPDRIRVCSDLSSAFNNLGFKPELSFHKFLYPSKEDLYALVRFLVGKVSESSGAASRDHENARGAAKEKFIDERKSVQSEEILTKSVDLRLNTLAIDSSYLKSQEVLDHKSAECYSVLPTLDARVDQPPSVAGNDLNLSVCRMGNHSLDNEGLTGSVCIDQDSSQNQRTLENPMVANDLELQHLDERGLLNTAAEMIFGGQHPADFYIKLLNDKVEAERRKLKELQVEWDAIEKTLKEQKRSLEQSLSELYPEATEKIARKKEIELENDSIIAEIKRREEELYMLSSDLEKQPKQAPRRYYIERINEITKNSRKQDNDIQRILKDTRELQLESNTIQERLNRTYAVVNETTFREAKKDPVARQAHKLLTDIHESFEQIAEKILAADRSQRDAADYGAKLAIMSSRSFNAGKLETDLDAIRKENAILEERLRNS